MSVQGERANRARSSIIVIMGWVLAGVVACGVDNRPLTSVGSSGAGAGGTAEGTGGAGAAGAGGSGALLGAACTGAAACGSGFCVDGVCCNSPCLDVCASCAAPGSEGTCSPVAQDELCSALACATATECRSVDSTQAVLNCIGIGQCRREAECSVNAVEAGTPCQNETGACTGDGACAVPGKLLLGEGCATDEDCGEGHCVPNAAGVLICCGGACDGECQQCSDAGHCEAAPAGDPRCLPVTCPGDNVCRDYAGDLTSDLCRGFGSCASSLDCTYTWLRPEADCACNEAGGCSLLPGRACSVASECGSQACEETAGGARVCCASACEAGSVCREDGSACVQCAGEQVTCEGNVEQRCGADGVLATAPCENGCTPGQGCNTQPAVGLPCAPDGSCIAAAVCQADVTGVQRCCARDCTAEGRVCAENGSCVCSTEQAASGEACLLRAGDPCAVATECESGSCVDGVCCQEACGGTCERCESGTGLCLADAAGQADTACAAGSDCSGTRGTCVLRVGEVCTAPEGCASGLCTPAVSGDLRCCAVECAAPQTCSSDGTRCVECEADAAASCGNGCDASSGVCNPLRPVGAACAVGAQCSAPGLCLADSAGTSRCCEANCTALGRVCGAAGLCVCAADQVEVGGACLAVDGSTCAAAGDCANGACEAVVGGGARRCCAADCPATALCAADGSACIDQRGAVGARCEADADCQNGNCANGVCCGEDCGGCQRCALGSGACEPDPSAACTLAGGGAGDCNDLGQCVDPGAGPGQPCGARACRADLTCTGGQCCLTACNGTCESGCGSDGRCVAPTSDDACGAVDCDSECQEAEPLQDFRSCLGVGVCSTANPCGEPVDIEGECALPGGGAGQCAGGSCGPPLAGPGQACTVDSDCTSGTCFGGGCCMGSCTGSCMTCLGVGACVPKPDRSPCDEATSATRLCAFNGICDDPTFQCNGSEIDVAGENACCNVPFAGTHIELASTVANCLELIGGPMFCDADQDCRLGQVCSRDGAAGGSRCVPEGPTAEGRICGTPLRGFAFLDCGPGLQCDITPVIPTEDTFIPMPLDWASCFPL